MNAAKLLNSARLRRRGWRAKDIERYLGSGEPFLFYGKRIMGWRLGDVVRAERDNPLLAVLTHECRLADLKAQRDAEIARAETELARLYRVARVTPEQLRQAEQEERAVEEEQKRVEREQRRADQRKRRAERIAQGPWRLLQVVEINIAAPGAPAGRHIRCWYRSPAFPTIRSCRFFPDAGGIVTNDLFQPIASPPEFAGHVIKRITAAAA
jgi:hypothetical protein